MNRESPENTDRPNAAEDQWTSGSAQRWVGGWVTPIVVIAFTVGWCLLIYLLIGDRPRDWQYGVMPYVPAQSFVSTRQAPVGAPPKQVVLPGTSTPLSDPRGKGR